MMKKILFCLLFITTIILGANACDCYEDCKYKNDRTIVYRKYDSDILVVNYHSFTAKINNTVTYYHCTIERCGVSGKVSVDLKVRPTDLTIGELFDLFYNERKDTLLQ